MSCLFPKADDLKTYWANIKNGVDAITPIPIGSHWNAADYFDPDPKAPDHTYAQRGGFLSPVNFNPMEFGIAPKDIEATDTSQLLSLVAAQRALVDAGYATGSHPGRQFDRERTSVILGVTGALELVIPLGARLGHPHWRRALKDAGVDAEVAEDVVQRISDSYVGWQENSFPGLLGNVAAGRIANRLDIGGTNCVVDAACASSLAAIHLASLELAAGLSDMVITGGVDTFNDIFMYMCFSKTPALSPSGDAKPFDSDCDGTVLGEGLGVLVIKRLADAERDGDRIYAVLKGMGSSSDGRSSAIYAPRAGGQKLAVQRAYAAAGVTPGTIELIEAHGTGTKVGDATELSSLTEVFHAEQHAGAWCALGSVKSQIGHTKAAAGVAGIIKAAMALHHKVLPPTIKVKQPLEGATPGNSPFYVNTSKRPWLPSAAHPRRAGISALGFGGTNFHCVLEEHDGDKPGVDWDGDVEILAFCGERLEDLKAQLAGHETDSSWPDFRRVAHESRRQFRAEADCRLLIVVTSQSDRASLKDAALQMLEKHPGKTSWTAPAGIAFGSGKVQGKIGALFPGQGSQYVGMLRDLACQFPGMLKALADADSVFASDPAMAGARRLSESIYPHPVFSDEARGLQDEALKATEIAQPALGAVSLGAFNVLNSFGVAVEAACGHSYGELLALCGAGRITPEALHRLSNVRGRLMANRAGQGDRGAMLAVQAGEEAVLEFLGAEKNDLVIANRNSPRQHVLAGPLEQIKRAAEQLTKRSIRSRVLQVSAAFHSALVADARAPFADALRTVAFSEGNMPVYANSTGAAYPNAEDAARDLLANQIVRPVNFMQQIQSMYADGVRTFVEIGPGRVLTDLVQSIMPDGEAETIALDASKGTRSGVFDLALALGRLAALGHPVELTKWETVPLPIEAASPKPALTVPLTGANHRTPRSVRPPTMPPRAPARIASPAISAPVTADPVRAVPKPVAAFAPEPQELPAALRAAQEGILALQRLQEETARLHKQFLEGQESARIAIQSLLRLPGQATMLVPDRTTHVVSPAPSAPAPDVGLRAAPGAAHAASLRTADHIHSRPGSQPAIGSVRPDMAPDRSVHERTVLEVVSEKTGYPVEMLNLGMGMDADLGIDSIKRVEIMAALRSRLPNAPEIKPEHLGSLQTLEHIVAFLAAGASAAPASASEMTTLPGTHAGIKKVLLDVVAEKTGYPVEMLNLDMGLDADLGIDSIKRVEIMAALRSQLPDAPEIRPEHLGSLQTLQQIVDFLGAGSPAVQMGVAAERAGASRVTEVLLAVVAEKTGYPVEMLNLDMGLDADLGIDSIKRVEIMAALRSQLPDAPEIRPEHLGSLQTLQQIVNFLVGSPDKPASLAGANAAGPTPSIGVGQSAAQVEVMRQLVHPVDIPVGEHRETLKLPRGANVWLIDDDSELSGCIEKGLQARHLTVHRGALQKMLGSSALPAPAALMILSPSTGCDSAFLEQAFRQMQFAGPALRKTGGVGTAIFVTVSRLDGAFGFGNMSADADPISGGLSGLVKTARLEWPEVHCKAIDLDPASALGDGIAEQLVDEMFRAGPVEVGLSNGKRVALEIEYEPAAPAAIDGNPLPLNNRDVVVISGGGRGVTGDAALALARTFHPTLVLLGRSRLDDVEPEWVRGLHAEADIKKALFAKLPRGTLPSVVESDCRQLLAQREIRAQMDRIKSVGAHVEYCSVDVRDAAQVARVLAGVRQRHGSIRGLIHGAGVLADRRIEDKTPAQFEAVYGTKVTGLENLLVALAHDDLKVLGLFSSYTARFGRVGQVDYAAANEVLNKLAQRESRRRPGCRVVSVNWGPWNGGMVTPGLRKIFENEGVGLIEPAAGADFLVRELCSHDRNAVEVLALAPSPQLLATATVPPGHEAGVFSGPKSSVAFEREVSVAALPFLESHVINGRAVLPAALMVEWLAQAALHGNPGMRFHGLDDFKVLKGVVLDAGQSISVSLMVGAGKVRDKLHAVPVRMVSESGGRQVLHAQADVLLTEEKLPAAPVADVVDFSGGAIADAYSLGVLFHGAALHGIECVEVCAEQGVAALLKAASAPIKWMRNPLRGTWIADPLALDSAFQMMILWSAAHRGGPSLPSALGRYRQFVSAFPKGGCRAVIGVALGISAIAVASIQFLDRQGNLLASAEGCEFVVDAALRDAFRLNRLKLEK
jgi:acyl transferase domain-containing protein/NAD(P)-dependent dehydrogenase (short-subunit alcohol dehydrogenase family)